jgi:hypothetical protein
MFLRRFDEGHHCVFSSVELLLRKSGRANEERRAENKRA